MTLVKPLIRDADRYFVRLRTVRFEFVRAVHTSALGAIPRRKFKWFHANRSPQWPLPFLNSRNHVSAAFCSRVTPKPETMTCVSEPTRDAEPRETLAERGCDRGLFTPLLCALSQLVFLAPKDARRGDEGPKTQGKPNPKAEGNVLVPLEPITPGLQPVSYTHLTLPTTPYV